MHCSVKTSLLIVFSFLLLASASYADEIFGATVGASYELGQLGDSGIGLQNRNMSAEAFEVLLGYRLNSEWLIGIDGNYRFEHQLSSLSSSGGTNLAGKGYLIGLGAKYTLSQLWSLQGAINFLGKYTFDHQTDQQEDDHLHSPLNLRFKGQYFFLEKRPLSADVVFDYQSWNKFHVAGVDHSNPASQWMIGVGLTYHFGTDKIVAPVTQVAEAKPVIDEPKKTSTEEIKIEGTAFNSSSATLSEESKAKIKSIGELLAKKSNIKIFVKGYTDSSGRSEKNKKLSFERAQSVKRALVSGGMAEKIITAEGFGDRDPLVDNTTPEGRAKNRRVEIQVQELP